MADRWKRTLEFLGLAEPYEDEYDDIPEDDLYFDEDVEHAEEEPTNVRRIAPSGTGAAVGSSAASGSGRRDTGGYHSSVAEREPREAPGGSSRGSMRPVRSTTVHITTPSTFNDVEEVGEKFRTGIPVIMNLASANENVAKRLLDFASGLIFGLDGRIERVGDRVFLLTPVGTEISTEERRRLSERGFFNQA